MLQPPPWLIQCSDKLSVDLKLLYITKGCGGHLGTQLLMQEAATAAEGHIVGLANDDRLITAQLICHDHGRSSRRLAGDLLQQLMRCLFVVDHDERHTQNRHGANAPIAVLMLEPMLMFRGAIWGEVFDVSDDRIRLGARGQFASGRLG